MKHKHADLIHAWADGAEIQSRYTLSQQGTIGYNWEEDKFPTWASNKEYRIKPEEKKPVVRWLWAERNGLITEQLYTEEEIDAVNCTFTIKLEWSRTEFPE